MAERRIRESKRLLKEARALTRAIATAFGEANQAWLLTDYDLTPTPPPIPPSTVVAALV